MLLARELRCRLGECRHGHMGDEAILVLNRLDIQHRRFISPREDPLTE
jgi:hypothetical protein